MSTDNLDLAELRQRTRHALVQAAKWGNPFGPARIDLDAAAVVAEFIQQQEVLLACLAQSRQADLNAIKIPLSISRWIKLRLGDVLQFLIAHNERHLLQAKRNLVNGY